MGSRRQFLQKSLAFSAAMAGFKSWAQMPSQKLRVACIGVGGGIGWSDVANLAGEHLVAFCDVNSNAAAKTYKKYPKVPRFTDYRKMLEKMHKEIDAVAVSTPDHMHFPMTKAAIELGKHVFVQKPLTHTVWEARELQKLAKQHKVITQMGNQGRAGDGLRTAYEWVHSGELGKIKDVYIVTDRPFWPQGIERPKGIVPVPKNFDWNLWLGVAPERPYHSKYLQPYAWRAWWDFGSGPLGDMGPHLFDVPFFTLNLQAPSHIAAKSSTLFTETVPEASRVTYKFPAMGDREAVTVRWQDASQPFTVPGWEWLNINTKSYCLMVGEKAVMKTNEYSSDIDVFYKDKTRAKHSPKKTLERLTDENPHREWVRAIQNGTTPGSHFDYSAPLTEIVLLGTIAIRTGGTLAWDASALKFKNSEKANTLLTKNYRSF